LELKFEGRSLEISIPANPTSAMEGDGLNLSWGSRGGMGFCRLSSCS